VKKNHGIYHPGNSIIIITEVTTSRLTFDGVRSSHKKERRA